MDGRPQIQDVPLQAAIRLETLKYVPTKMDGERSLRGLGVTVHRTATAALLPAAAHAGPDAQMLEYLPHRHLVAQVCEIDLGSSRSRGLG